MKPAEFAEVNKILRKAKTTKAEDKKILQSYECLCALLGGKERVNYLQELVLADENKVINALKGIK